MTQTCYTRILFELFFHGLLGLWQIHNPNQLRRSSYRILFWNILTSQALAAILYGNIFIMSRIYFVHKCQKCFLSPHLNNLYWLCRKAGCQAFAHINGCGQQYFNHCNYDYILYVIRLNLFNFSIIAMPRPDFPSSFFVSYVRAFDLHFPSRLPFSWILSVFIGFFLYSGLMCRLKPLQSLQSIEIASQMFV